MLMVAPGRVELPTFGLGNRCSIHLSYGAVGVAFTILHCDCVFLSPGWSGFQRADPHTSPSTRYLNSMKSNCEFQPLSVSKNRRWKRTTIELNQCSGS
jgi:hypothetical protein